MTRKIVWQEKKGERGAALVDFALSAPVVLFGILVLLQALWLSYKATMLQYLSVVAARDAVIETHMVEAVVFNPFFEAAVVAQGEKWGIPLKTSDVVLCSVTNPHCSSPGETIVEGMAFYAVISPEPGPLESFFNIRQAARIVGLNSNPVTVDLRIAG